MDVLTEAYIGAMGWTAGAFFVLWHGAIVVALAQAARRATWDIRPRALVRALLVAAAIVTIVTGAMVIGIRDMPPGYYHQSNTK